MELFNPDKREVGYKTGGPNVAMRLMQTCKKTNKIVFDGLGEGWEKMRRAMKVN